MRAQQAVCALLALTCARAEINIRDVRNGRNTKHSLYGRRSIDVTVAGGCMSSGRWFAEGAAVAVRDACLRCRCARGALVCTSHCLDGTKTPEPSAAVHLEDDAWDVATPAAPGHACVEEGAIFAAGSALSARAACEHCFCLRGARRCVRPRCLPPPPGCAPRPAPAGCCPQRYYCSAHAPATPATPATPVTPAPHHHDCEVAGEWVPEGERVTRAAEGGACSQCFCLRGAVRCQPLACAPALRGCAPLLRAGRCCPHRYRCPQRERGPEVSVIPAISDNASVSTRSDERTFRTSASTKIAIATESLSPSVLTSRSRSAEPPTTKVKRKTDDGPPPTSTPARDTTAAPSPPASPPAETATVTPPAPPVAPASDRTEQPDNSAKVIINGTINCTAELSSGVPDATAMSATDRVESQSRTPASDAAAEEPAADAAEIITERGVSVDFDERDSFTVNVSSSLTANTSHAAPPPAPPAPADLAPAHNVSENAKDDYDYDYTEPTLPPSLPNLKIIPFVAADAVVDEAVSAKEAAFEKEAQFPVYYPGGGGGEGPAGATRRQDGFGAGRYPVFASESGAELLLAEASQAATRPPAATSTRHPTVSTPALNLFSPPVETEGGFVPKGPGGELYAAFPRTPPPAPLLTTSMQINPNTPDIECITSEGTRVPAGSSVRAGCALCACEWGELRCEPLPCRAPPPCRRAPALSPASAGPCCGELICPHDNVTTSTGAPVTRRPEPAPATLADALQADLLPFDPPPDRREPASSPPAPSQSDSLSQAVSEITEATVSSTPPSTTTDSTGSERRSERPATTTGSTSPPSAPPLPPASSPPLSDDITTLRNDTEQHSQEYDDEDDDEGFSFGSVLKLLLSDGYETTTAATSKRKPVTMAPPPPSAPTAAPPSSQMTTRKVPPRVTPGSPAPPPSYPFTPPKKVLIPNTVNKIDHLVLGEATAIRRSTARPATSPPSKRLSTRAGPRRPVPLPAPAPAVPAAARPPAALAGLFKLAGCNIYGRMYRVGRIIAELSTPCQECRCTELGVQCAPLPC